MMSFCCYARGIQVLAYRDFNEVIDDPISGRPINLDGRSLLI